VDRSGLRIAAAARAAEDRTARFRRAVRPTFRTPARRRAARPGLTGPGSKMDIRMHMIGMVVCDQLRR
jgi:hypothetical protein